jgi:S-DNA-T family DNA segregation ATPase FtsK/SpoIIIE
MKKSTVTGFMLKLVEEGWLIKHKSQVKGYELIATEEMMAEYKE